ncbi:MAG TPA: cytochrome c oxidase subunit 3 [Terriglobales bacterium]|nr:cytochrome c oxidase subunit 3 [Terriglobales bacterium]
MATTVHEPPKSGRLPGRSGKEESGNGGGRNLIPAEGDLRAIQDRSPEPARTGIWIALATITMSFAAFTSALIVRQGSATDWQHITLPRVLYFNTLVLLASSVTLEVSRRRVASYMRGMTSGAARPLGWLYATLFLGVVFVVGQYAAWVRLKSEGLYLATSPTSSFFYVLTAVHALHVLGGLGGLVNVIQKLSRSVATLRRSTLDATSYYWHFMGILWLYLLLLLWLKF